MKHRDHVLLSDWLLSEIEQKAACNGTRRPFSRVHAFFFRLGSVEPDANPFTYMRGMKKSHGMFGHNTLFSDPRVKKLVARFESYGIKSALDAFFLGTLVHYLADSFTYPHTPNFLGSMNAHRRYEIDLREHFPAYLDENKREAFRSSNALPAELDAMHILYAEEEKHSPQNDASYIVKACGITTCTLLFSCPFDKENEETGADGGNEENRA